MTAAAKVWTELKQKEKVRPTPDLDALAIVELSGFMREYVWHYLRRPDWNEPAHVGIPCVAEGAPAFP